MNNKYYLDMMSQYNDKELEEIIKSKTHNNKSIEAAKEILSQRKAKAIEKSLKPKLERNPSFEEPVVHFIENVFFQYAPKAKSVGDLFFTPSRLHFIPYANFPCLGNEFITLGAIYGGFTGGLAASLSKNDELNKAVNIAREIRAQQWGMPIAERLKRNGKPLTFNKDEIIDIDFGDYLTINIDHSPIFFDIPKSTKYVKIKKEWMEMPLYNNSAVCVISAKFKAPHHLINSLISGDILNNESAYQLDGILTDRIYMSRFLRFYEKLDSKNRLKVNNTASKINGKFRDKFNDIRISEVKEGKRNFKIGSYCLIASIVLITLCFILNFIDWELNPDNVIVSILSVFIIIGILITAILGINFLSMWYKSKKYK
jgi:hypothetical protein